jgi:membrane dipeptidase
MIKITEGPIIATHSNSRSVFHNSRNLTDDMFRAICETGGIAGYNACDEFTGSQPTVDTICDHIFHFLELDPTGKHIALGGDLDGCDHLTVGFVGVQSYPAMAQKLLDRGLTEQMVQRIFWDNGMGVFEKCCM